MDVNGVLTNTATAVDGQTGYMRGCAGNALAVAHVNGRWYELVRRGMVFIASTAAAGVALPAYNHTAQVFMLWNPADSGVNLELICATFGKVSTTGTDGNICWSYKAGMGAAIGVPCSAYTAGTPLNALVGGSPDGTTFFAPGTATVTATALLRTSGITQTEVADAQISPPYPLIESFEQNPIVLAPGSAIFPTQNITGATVWVISVTYAKVPV